MNNTIISKLIEEIKNYDVHEMVKERIELSNGAYAIINSYETKSEDVVRFESHRKYIDIQYMICGQERVYQADVSELDIFSHYSEIDDVVFYHDPVECKESILSAGEYLVFGPSDAHKPSVMVDKPRRVKKVVIKVPVENR